MWFVTVFVQFVCGVLNIFVTADGLLPVSQIFHWNITTSCAESGFHCNRKLKNIVAMIFCTSSGCRAVCVVISQWNYIILSYKGSLTYCGLMTPYGDISGPTLAQVMDWHLMAPSHYLKQCWLIIIEVLWHSPEGNFTGNAQDIYPWYEFENY